MAYTIKGLAKANECETFDEMGLALVWDYWLTCNCNDMQCVNDFRSLRAGDRIRMISFLYEKGFEHLATHIRARCN